VTAHRPYAPQRARLEAVVGVASAAGAASACVGPHHVFDPAGGPARDIAALGWVLFGVCGVVYVLVMLALTWALLRRRTDADGSAETGRRLSHVVAVATGATAATIVALTIASAATGHGLTSPTGAGAVTVDAIGHQWWWDFQYRDVSPGEFVSTPNELHVPLGQPIVIKTMSRDVIHSFWVPSLHGKRDLVPGQLTQTWITADRPGTYRGLCAEFCGHQHARMAFTVVAEPMEKFTAWIEHQRGNASEPATDEERRGRDVFLGSPCATCHTIRGTSAASRIGPDLTHVGSRMTLAAGTLPNTAAHLAKWISDPQAIKPGSRMPDVPLSNEDRRALIAYLRRLQ
jgi:cytochrome c oxidase subunit II